jgi:ketosteroid isomerase-like protein
MEFDRESFVKKFMDVWNSHDLEGIIAMFTEDIVFESSFGDMPWGMQAVGKDAARELIVDVFNRVPDIQFKELRHFVCPEHATVESLSTGTPVGGKPYEVHLVDVLTLRDQKIAAKRSYRKAKL